MPQRQVALARAQQGHADLAQVVPLLLVVPARRQRGTRVADDAMKVKKLVASNSSVSDRRTASRAQHPPDELALHGRPRRRDRDPGPSDPSNAGSSAGRRRCRPSAPSVVVRAHSAKAAFAGRVARATDG
ncbi:MAG: hypothetical protein MZV64_04555 [Ignavibacteriales bacterium]|nr:hypothetical protein [Ignavibacteriales bacterium]